jgi:hypothetical protein
MSIFNDAAKERRSCENAQPQMIVRKWFNARRYADEWIQGIMQTYHDRIYSAIRDGVSVYKIRTEITREQLRKMEWDDSYKTITTASKYYWDFSPRDKLKKFLMAPKLNSYRMVIPEKTTMDMGLEYNGNPCPITVRGNIRRKWGLFSSDMVDVTIKIDLNPYDLEKKKYD